MPGILLVLRTVFVITTASVFYQLAKLVFDQPNFHIANISAIIAGSIVGIYIIWVEIKYSTRFLVGIFTVILGLLVGFIASYLFVQALFLIPHVNMLKDILPAQYQEIRDLVNVAITFLFCYLSVAVLYRTKNRFKLLIPFVDFTKEVGDRRLILDSSIIIDGRISNICETGIMKGNLVIPKFILDEVQSLADCSDKQKRIRGRRGLEILAELQKNKRLDVTIEPQTFPNIKEVDNKLIALAQEINGIVITNDYNLKKIAQLQDVEVINLNSLANALKPTVFPGELIDIRIVKQGEEAEQGIGYLEDGTVVIVENTRRMIGKNVSVVVTNVLQNNIGRMVFAKLNEG
ncbi:PIN/TRAM domain-containing protein [Candidatus Uabimicrobium sp. HlEnr_7]|uniref:PIN/TRAM domain-containing protein n=1 Tax=Candidatus Uabimicrobium helgolandensis TaxID=3095367 RepID=UPI0035573C18